MKSDVKISTVTLTYNRKDILRQCIEHIMMYTDNNHEIIVVDNGSTDGTQEMIREYFPDIILILLKGNSGGWCRNYGFEVSRGEYIGQIDDDTIVGPHWDSILLRYFEEDVGIVGPQGWVFTNWERPNEGKKAENGEYCDYLTGFLWLQKNNPRFRYDKRFGYWHEDLDFSLRVKSFGYRLKQSLSCCSHLAKRPFVDRKKHDKGLDLVKRNWIQSSKLKFEEFNQREFLQNQSRP